MSDIQLGSDFSHLNVDRNFMTQETGEVEKSLALLKAAGKSGEELLPPVKAFALGMTEAALPAPTTRFDASHAPTFFAMPSIGASMLAAITDAMDEQRRLANQARVEQTLSTVGQLRNQADEIRSNATTQLVIGIVSSTVKLAAAGLTTGMSMKNLHMSGHKLMSDKPLPDAADVTKNLKKDVKTPEMKAPDVKDTLSQQTIDKAKGLSAADAAERMRIDTMQARNITLKAMNDGIMAGVGAIDATKQFLQASHEARMKDLDAQIELSRALTQQMAGFEESFKTVLRKAIDAQNAIQQNTNQTRTRILG